MFLPQFHNHKKQQSYSSLYFGLYIFGEMLATAHRKLNAGCEEAK
jgi:hypothetical protein